VGKKARILLATAAVVILSVALVLSDMAIIGSAVLVAGMLAVALLYQRLEPGPDADSSSGDAEDAGQGRAKLDQAVEDARTGGHDTGTAPLAPGAPSAGGLPTWSPAGLDTWNAPTPAPTAEPQPELRPTDPADPDRPATGSAWDAWQDYDRGPVAEDYDDENPLAALDRLDDIDPVAEVERLEGLGSEPASAGAPSKNDFSFSGAPRSINEAAVQTADDVMAASEATELHVNDGQDSELARLLAKVQARLASYE
jgi:hypothetical protein